MRIIIYYVTGLWWVFGEFTPVNIYHNTCGIQQMLMIPWHIYKVIWNLISKEIAPQFTSYLHYSSRVFMTLSHQDDRTPDVVSLFSNYLTPLTPHFPSGLIGSNCRPYQCEWCYFLINELPAQGVLPYHVDEHTGSSVIPQITVGTRTGLRAAGSVPVSGHMALPATDGHQTIHSDISLWLAFAKRPFLKQSSWLISKPLANIIT